MNLIQKLEQEEIARLGRKIPDFVPGDTVIVSVNVVEGERKRVQAFEGVVIARRNRSDDCVGDCFPAEQLVRSSPPFLHGQRVVEEEHSLPSPTFEVAAIARRQAKVARQFLVDIDQ